MFSLKGKTAVVTGANRGIGFAMAQGLAQAGADIIGVSVSILPAGSEIEQAVTRIGRKFTAIRTNFSEPLAVQELAAELRIINPDILINNAGIINRAPAITHSDEIWRTTLEVNLTSQFTLAREVGAAMVHRGSGKIIFTASLLSFQGGINVPSYAASKSAISGLTKALANEWAPMGVNVNAIAPGYIATDNTDALRKDPERSRAILERIPAGKWGQANDLVGASVFLASQASDYVHGVTLPVDGGWLAR